MKKVDKSRIEYAIMNHRSIFEGTIPDIENRSEAVVNDNELEFIKAHWQDKIKKHTPFINTEKDKERLKLDVENL